MNQQVKFENNDRSLLIKLKIFAQMLHTIYSLCTQLTVALWSIPAKIYYNFSILTLIEHLNICHETDTMPPKIHQPVEQFSSTSLNYGCFLVQYQGQIGRRLSFLRRWRNHKCGHTQVLISAQIQFLRPNVRSEFKFALNKTILNP